MVCLVRDGMTVMGPVLPGSRSSEEEPKSPVGGEAAGNGHQSFAEKRKFPAVEPVGLRVRPPLNPPLLLQRGGRHRREAPGTSTLLVIDGAMSGILGDLPDQITLLEQPEQAPLLGCRSRRLLVRDRDAERRRRGVGLLAKGHALIFSRTSEVGKPAEMVGGREGHSRPHATFL
jgi:hypothetical protein